MRFGLLSVLATGLLSACPALAALDTAATGKIRMGPFNDELNGSNFTYPYDVHVFEFQSQQQTLQMAFMDVAPTCKPNGKVILMLHGKNYCGATWRHQITALAAQGYRLIVADHIGFCRSSKPRNYQFSLETLAYNAQGLMLALGIKKHILMAHSFGGMIAIQYSLQYPEAVELACLVDPIGLENYLVKGVPYISIDANIEQESLTTYDSLRAYEQALYYVGEWQDDFDIWVNMLLEIYNGPLRDDYIKNQGQIVDLVLTETVASYFEDIQVPVLLMIGDKDRTAIGIWSDPAVFATLGHYDVLGPEVAARIPNCTLFVFEGFGHAPFISNPAHFDNVLLNMLPKHLSF